MAFTTIKPIPLFMPLAYAAGTAQSTTLNSTDDWLAWVFYWPGGDLTQCAFQCTAATGSPVVTAQLFNTDATDAGSTPVNTGSAIGSAVDSATLSANTLVTVSGIGQSSLSAGIYALRLIFKSGTSCAVLRNHNGAWMLGGNVAQFPFNVTVTDGGAQTKVQPQGCQLALGGSTFVPVDGLTPPYALTLTGSFGSGSNPDEYGLWFTNPLPVTVRLSSVAFYQAANSRPDIRLAIYSGSLASPTQSVAQTFDRDLSGSLSVAGMNWLHLSEANHYSLASGATIGIGLRASTTENMNLYYANYGTGNEVVMDAGWGQNATYFTRENDTGALTQTTTRTPLIIPVIDGIDAGSSSGGGYVIGA